MQNNSLSPQNKVYDAHGIVLGKTKQDNSFKLDHNQKISKEVSRKDSLRTPAVKILRETNIQCTIKTV